VEAGIPERGQQLLHVAPGAMEVDRAAGARNPEHLTGKVLDRPIVDQASELDRKAVGNNGFGCVITDRQFPGGPPDDNLTCAQLRGEAWSQETFFHQVDVHDEVAVPWIALSFTTQIQHDVAPIGHSSTLGPARPRHMEVSCASVQ